MPVYDHNYIDPRIFSGIRSADIRSWIIARTEELRDQGFDVITSTNDDSQYQHQWFTQITHHNHVEVSFLSSIIGSKFTIRIMEGPFRCKLGIVL